MVSVQTKYNAQINLYNFIAECHLIKDSDSESLDKVLQKVDEDPEKICSHLNLKNCIKLKQENKLKPFHFAESYLSQHEEPCWEEIVAMLCGMDKRKLAKQVANRHDVNYELKCPNSTQIYVHPFDNEFPGINT